jgi:hypothetical protein
MNQSIYIALVIYGMGAVIAFFVAFLIKGIIVALKVKKKPKPDTELANEL